MRAWRAASGEASWAMAPAERRMAARPRAKVLVFMAFSSGGCGARSPGQTACRRAGGRVEAASLHQRRLEMGPDQRAAVDLGRARAEHLFDELAAHGQSGD